VNTWKVILATMLIFGTGVITGSLLVRKAEPVRTPRTSQNAALRQAQSVSPGGMRIELLRRMERELDLSPEQRELADKIIKESQDRTRKIMEPVAPQMRDELQLTKERFRAVLTPEQRKRFDELSKQPARPRESRRPGRLPDGPSAVPSPSGDPARTRPNP
jgi:Spy/CpxP family protein refolding chaperone